MAENGDGEKTLRAIARGRVYVIINYPREVEQLEGNHFHEGSYNKLLAELQTVGHLLGVWTSSNWLWSCVRHIQWLRPQEKNRKGAVHTWLFRLGCHQTVMVGSFIT